MKKLITIFLVLIFACTAFVGCRKTQDAKHIQNGQYTCSVSIKGGSGSTAMKTPATIIVKNGGVTARIVWESPDIEYMIVKEERYDPTDSSKEAVGDNSKRTTTEFVIPMDFDMDFPVSALDPNVDPDAPTEYTLYFDSSTLRDYNASKH